MMKEIGRKEKKQKLAKTRTLQKLTKKPRKRNKFGHVKCNHLKKKLEAFIVENANKKYFSVLLPRDFSTTFVEEVKILSENEKLASWIENCLQTLVRNTIKNSVRIKKIDKNNDTDSQKINKTFGECDILSDDSKYGDQDIGLKLTACEISSLNFDNINEEFELHLRKYDKEWRKFCTKISKII